MYELCESTSIILPTYIYSSVSYPDPYHLEQTGAIVMSLLIDFIGKGSTIYVDNYYISLRLTQQFSSNKTYICVTLRSDHKVNPKEINKKKLQKCKIIWSRAGTVSVCKWKNCQGVLTISDKHSVEFVEMKNKCGQVREKPNIVRDYNDGMTGIDRFDQMLSYYSYFQKSVGWYKKIGYYYVEIFVFKAHCFNTKFGKSKLSRIHFRYAMVKCLLGDMVSQSLQSSLSSPNFHYLK